MDPREILAVERFLRLGTRTAAKEALAVGRPAAPRLLAEVIRACRARLWLPGGRRAGKLLYFLPYDPIVTDIMWRIDTDLEFMGDFDFIADNYCARAGASVLGPYIAMLTDPGQHDNEKLGATGALEEIWHNFPELRPDIAQALRQAVEEADEGSELTGSLAGTIMSLGIADLAPDIVRAYEEGRATEEDLDLESFREWMEDGSRPDEVHPCHSPTFEYFFPVKVERWGRPPRGLEDALQTGLEEWAARRPDAALPADAFLDHRLEYGPSTRLRFDYLVGEFLLRFVPGNYVSATDEDEAAIPGQLEDFFRFLERRGTVGATSRRRVCRSIRERRVAFDEMRRSRALFGRSKRMILAARKEGRDWRDRAAVLDWWNQEGLDLRDAPAWHMPYDYRLGDAWIPGRTGWSAALALGL